MRKKNSPGWPMSFGLLVLFSSGILAYLYLWIPYSQIRTLSEVMPWESLPPYAVRDTPAPSDTVVIIKKQRVAVGQEHQAPPAGSQPNPDDGIVSLDEAKSFWASLSPEWRQIFRKTLEYKGKPSRAFIEKIFNLTAISTYHAKLKTLKPLSYLTKLEKIYLTNTPISDLSEIANLTNVQELSLAGTFVSSLEPIKGYTKLQNLYLNQTDVISLEPIRNLTRLRTLWCVGTKITDITPLANMSQMMYLDISRTSITDISSVKNMTNLSVLDISNTQIIDLSPVSGLKNLRYLYLNNTPITSLAPLSAVHSLKKLYLMDSEVRSLEGISPEMDLQELNCRGSKVPSHQAKALLKAIPQLELVADEADTP